MIEKIEEVLRGYEAALGTQQWDVVSPYFAEDAVVIFSEGTYFGKSEIEVAFRKTFDLIKEEKYRIDDLRWVDVRSTSALCIYTFQWFGKIRGDECTGGGRGTTLLVAEGGSWVIKHEHLGPPKADA